MDSTRREALVKDLSVGASRRRVWTGLALGGALGPGDGTTAPGSLACLTTTPSMPWWPAPLRPSLLLPTKRRGTGKTAEFCNTLLASPGLKPWRIESPNAQV